MPSLNEVVRHYTDLGEADLDWLHLLVADWQIIADLSFADLVLWVPDRDGHGFWAAAQMRPTTGPTAFVDDLVGAFVPRERRPLLDAAYDQGRIAREGDPEWRDDVPVRVETIPVCRAGRVLGVIARNTNLLGVRTPSRLELAYLQTATDLAKMISEGSFPMQSGRSELSDSPRVGDGFVRLDPTGVVTYASPNAQSAYRRMGLAGDLVGEHLGELTATLLPGTDQPIDESVTAAVSGRLPREADVENTEATLILRSIPLRQRDVHMGALVLIRDVTELRRRERELLTREATIREIHHRVKNNLQTVAALLRLQARRLPNAEGRSALEEAVRRVGSIAIVHDTLSQTFEESVDFDQVADRLRAMVVDVASPEGSVETRREGSFGVLTGEVATPLAMVLTELLQNAVEHGLRDRAGTVTLRARRGAAALCVDVDDSGVGLPDAFDPTDGTLGLSIVTTLVQAELGGELAHGVSPEGGARMTLQVPIAPRT
ncbi:MAG TPA: sensor histidine kinase [Nocardioidaceae bacterium]|nr:sensor histidine kinase [Nocardioidaceae bacterium]